jgi:hypothetical protein
MGEGVGLIRTLLLGSLGVILVLGIGINAAYMLISPRAWFRLPSWLRASGPLSEKRYGSGAGAIELRVTGAISLAVIVWVIYDLFRG